MDNNSTIKRFDWIDIAKGIGMLLVIIAHCSIGRYGDIIFSFHMPLFFICSGFTLRVSQTVEDFKKKTKRGFLYLMGNAFGIFLVQNILEIVFSTEERSTSGNILGFLSEFLLEFIGGSGTGITFGSKTFAGVGIVWFLMALFWGRTIFDFLQLKCKRKVVFFLSIVIISVVGYVLGNIQWLPMSIDIAFVIQPFFLFGYVLKEVDLEKRLLLVCAGSLIGWLTFLIFLGIVQEVVLELVYRSYPLYPLCIACAMLGSMFIIGLGIVMNKYLKVPSIPLKILGKHSILMIWVHGLDLCVPFIKKITNATGNGYVNAMIRVLVDCSIFVMVLLLRKLFRNWKMSHVPIESKCNQTKV